MTGLFSATFRWGERRESASACADRAVGFLHEIQSLSKAFVNLGPIEGDLDEVDAKPRRLTKKLLQDVFERGVNRRDDDRSIIEDLGFSATLANPDYSIVIRMHAGCYCRIIPNICTVEILKLSNVTKRLISIPIMSRLFEEAVVAWEPERGLLTSTKLRDSVPQSPKVLNFGWITYLSKTYIIPEQVRRNFSVKDVRGTGNMIMAIDDLELIEKQDPRRVKELISACSANGV
jgi:hypothetical protein